MHKFLIAAMTVAAAALPLFAQLDVKADIVKHLKTEQDFTVKVAEAMPEADYGFKLTQPQMSFGEQLIHLASSLDFILAPMAGEKSSKPDVKPTDKAAVVKFVRDSYAKAIEDVSRLTPEQLNKEYTMEGHPATGFDLLLTALDHSTHHRASAEMYLRAKGITPPEYEF